MTLFYLLFIILLIASAIFYIVIFSFIYYWHLIKVSYIIVPLVFTFDFFAIGFMIISIITIVIKFLPFFLNF